MHTPLCEDFFFVCSHPFPLTGYTSRFVVLWSLSLEGLGIKQNLLYTFTSKHTDVHTKRNSGSTVYLKGILSCRRWVEASLVICQFKITASSYDELDQCRNSGLNPVTSFSLYFYKGNNSHATLHLNPE